MTEIQYNEDNDNANDEWTKSVDGEQITGKIVERIENKNLVQLTKPECQHKNVTRRPALEFEAEVIEIDCQDCPLGWFETVNRS